MAVVKILHSADMHIGATESFLGEKSKERQAETLITFEKSVSLARKEEVALYLIAGDLFDSLNIDYSYFRRVLNIIAEYSDIRFIYAAGNHDPLSPNSPLKEMKIPSNLYIFDTKDSFFNFDDIKVRVYGRSFREVCDNGSSAFSIIPPDDDYVNIMCIHGDFGVSDSSYNPITTAFIEKSCMDYVALGHIHKRTAPALLGGTYFAYCGCMECQGFDESGEKGAYLGYVSKSGVDLKFVPLSNRLHIRTKVDISGAESSAGAADIILRALSEEIGADFERNLYRITITGAVDENAAINAKEIAVRLCDKIYYAKVKDKTRSNLNLELLSREPSLKGIFVKNMLEKLENADESEKPLIEYALGIGLKAFSLEVTYNED